MQVDCIKSLPTVTNHPKRAWPESRDPFLNFLYHIFVIGEARHFKFCVLIDTEPNRGVGPHECMPVIGPPYSQQGYVQSHVT